jgi:transformer-2 protein
VLGVFGLHFQTDERDLRRLFERYGRVDKVKLVTDPRTNRSRGFSFIYFANVEDAEEAKDKVHGMELDGNHLRVEYSISNREHNPTPGVYMGRRNGGRDDDDEDDYRHGSGGGRKRARYDQSRSRSRSRSRSYEKSTPK